MFTTAERTAIFSLASIMAFRMLGLFIIIPIFSPYLQTLVHSTPLLIGLTMGIYGLTQAILQIPFGILSDYIGRREVITIGLLLFFLGSILAGSSDNIYIVLLGRALQGSGAISSSLIALLSDLTTEQSRTKAMAVLGMSIGSAFMAAFMFGPLLNSFIPVHKIFYLVAFLVLPILFILWKIVPVPDRSHLTQYNAEISRVTNIFHDKTMLKQLVLHSFGIFTLHGILMANFVAIPLLLKQLGLAVGTQGFAYIKVFLVAVLFMVPLIIYSEKNNKQKKVLILSVLLLFISELIFWLLSDTFWGIMLGMVVFFIGFNVLEASLPSIISKIAPKQNKGAALGMYSTAQFLGPMLGGLLSGILFKYYGLVSIFILGLVWASLWLCCLPYMQEYNNKD